MNAKQVAAEALATVDAVKAKDRTAWRLLAADYAGVLAAMREVAAGEREAGPGEFTTFVGLLGYATVVLSCSA